MVGNQDDLAERLPLQLSEDREAPFNTNWVFGRRRQEALLETFFDGLTPGESLVFLTKEGQPISDSINRLLIRIGENAGLIWPQCDGGAKRSRRSQAAVYGYTKYGQLPIFGVGSLSLYSSTGRLAPPVKRRRTSGTQL